MICEPLFFIHLVINVPWTMDKPYQDDPQTLSTKKTKNFIECVSTATKMNHVHRTTELGDAGIFLNLTFIFSVLNFKHLPISN